MDFSQYLQAYMNAKNLRGVTPGRNEATRLYAPYFDKQFAVEMMQRKQALAEKEQAAKEDYQGKSLAWDKEKATNTLATQKELAEGGMASRKSIAMAGLGADYGISMANLASRRDISTANLDWSKQQAANNLAFDMWRNGLLQDSAGRSDANSTWGNAIASLGSLGSGLLLRKYR